MSGNWNEADHPREPKGSSKGGQFTDVDTISGAAAAAAIPDYVTKELRKEWVRRLSGLDHEVAILIDPDTAGRIYEQEGQRGRVDFDVKQRRAANNKVLLHNHPYSNSPFSVEDVKFFLRFNLKEMWVIASDYIFKMKKMPEMMTYFEMDWNEFVFRKAILYDDAFSSIFDRRADSSYYLDQLKKSTAKIRAFKELSKNYGWDFEWIKKEDYRGE